MLPAGTIPNYSVAARGLRQVRCRRELATLASIRQSCPVHLAMYHSTPGRWSINWRQRISIGTTAIPVFPVPATLFARCCINTPFGTDGSLLAATIYGRTGDSLREISRNQNSLTRPGIGYRTITFLMVVIAGVER